MKKLTKVLFAAMFAVLCGAQAHALAVGSRGGKKSVARMIDSSGGPITFNDDKPWKVFESTGIGQIQLVDESGVAPKQGMIGKVCIGTAPVTTWGVVYDSNTVTGTMSTATGLRLFPPVPASTTLLQCFTVNALFTSGAVVEVSAAMAQNGFYVYWRELGGYR